ncbi:MAG: radical SAM protein [Thermoanaerobaculia bacterium]|nr:radical SAM protein [Thermoanaerobaculia bacterium]
MSSRVPDPSLPQTHAEKEGLGDVIPADQLAAVEAKLSSLASGDPRNWNGVVFPFEVAVELAAACNLDCIMCPVPTTSRPKTLMDPSLFKVVADQVAGENGILFLPQGFGESMLHAKWAELLEYAAQKGIRPIVMLTNGTLLNERNIERVLHLGVEGIVVSIDGTTPETYASVRVGGDLNKVEANVRRFLEMRGTSPRPKLVLRIIRMNETRAEIDEFFSRWTPHLRADDEIRINEYNDWSGKVADRSVDGLAAPAGRQPCRMLWRNLSVHADGKVSACCHDSEDELIVGDVASGDTLQGIWSGSALDRLRRIHLEGQFELLPICANCHNWM